uniref:BZIP domain-containing protein n=1 Tax=Oryza glumipatula TaxID=40148 RepID=A0A0E0AC41_9ORYZ
MMLSNRESARMRKQRHLDNLTAQVAHLHRENVHVTTALGLTTYGLLAVDAENAVLRTQSSKLAARLSSPLKLTCDLGQFHIFSVSLS